MFKKAYWVIFGSILGIVSSAFADCPNADKMAREKGLSEALPVYQSCAIGQNDDDSQLYLARIFATGQGSISKSRTKALLFYHLSAENGNATAMVELSKLLTEMDNDEIGRNEILTYLGKLQTQLRIMPANSFSGELLHPYALLMLAAESPESKWFYTTKQTSDPRAAQFLKNYKIDPDKKKEVIRAATQWKQRKMIDLAREVFSVSEFKEFYQTLYPKTGLPNSFARSQAVDKLKAKVESRKK